MINNICFLFFCVLSLLVSVSAQAERRIYSSNQGVKPKSFDASYFEGQWTVNKPKSRKRAAIDHFNQKKKPIFVYFTPAGLEELGERGDYFAGIKSITLAHSSYRQRDRLKHEIDRIRYQEYISENYPSEDFTHKKDKALYKSFLKEEFSEYDLYDNQSISYYTYSNDGRLFNYNPLVQFDYSSLNTMSFHTQYFMDEAIKWYKEKFNFDVVNETDFVFSAGWEVSFVFIDIVSDDLFLMYGSNKDSLVSAFKRIKNENEHELPKWKQYYQSKEGEKNK